MLPNRIPLRDTCSVSAFDILPSAPSVLQMQMHCLLYHMIFLFKCALHGMNETEPFCLMTRLSGTKNWSGHALQLGPLPSFSLKKSLSKICWKWRNLNRVRQHMAKKITLIRTVYNIDSHRRHDHMHNLLSSPLNMIWLVPSPQTMWLGSGPRATDNAIHPGVKNMGTSRGEGCAHHCQPLQCSAQSPLGKWPPVCSGRGTV